MGIWLEECDGHWRWRAMALASHATLLLRLSLPSHGSVLWSEFACAGDVEQAGVFAGGAKCKITRDKRVVDLCSLAQKTNQEWQRHVRELV